MNKIALAAAATMITISLAGCGNMHPFVAPSTDQQFVSAVRDAAPSLRQTPAATLIASGKGTCTALGQGHTVAALTARAVQFGLTAREGNAIIDAAIRDYCPQYGL